MLRKNIYILFLLFSTPLLAQVYPDIEKRGVPIASIHQVEGDWRCVMANRKITMEDMPSDEHLKNFRYRNDSIWRFEYPCAYYGLTIASKSIEDKYPLFGKISFLHDTLVVSSESMDFGGDWFYVRDTFDQKIVDILISDGFFLPALFGKWYLQTYFFDPYSGEPPYKIEYPFYLPPVFKLDKSDIVNKNTLIMNINGTLRKFILTRCSLYYGYITVEVDGWYKKETFGITYFDHMDKYD